MLTIKELQALYELLNKKEETLQQIESLFLSKFKDSHAVFKASFALSNLLSFNLLCLQQRIVAIFLLIENYSKDGIQKHPFGATIFQTLNNTYQSFQKKMIYDLILDKKRDQYSKVQIEVLYEKQQAMIENIQERPDFNTLKQQFIHKLPPLPESTKSEVSRVIKDFNEKQKQFEPPELPINVLSLKQSQISNETFNIGFLRPIPKFLPIGQQQFHWLNPLKVPNIQWDNTAQIEKKIAKIKLLMKKAQQQHLTKDECTQIERGLQSQPNIVLHLGITTQNISLLIKQNPFLAVAFLVKLLTYPIIQEYLQVIKDGEVSMNSIDVISRITKLAKIDRRFLVQYVQKIMQRVMQGTEKSDKPKLARMIINLIKNLKKKQSLNLQDIQGKLQKFVHQFIEIDEVQQFRKLWV